MISLDILKQTCLLNWKLACVNMHPLVGSCCFIIVGNLRWLYEDSQMFCFRCFFFLLLHWHRYSTGPQTHFIHYSFFFNFRRRATCVPLSSSKQELLKIPFPHTGTWQTNEFQWHNMIFFYFGVSPFHATTYGQPPNTSILNKYRLKER